MPKTITKGLIGMQDLALGTSTFTRATSTGGTMVLNQISAFTFGLVIPSGTVDGVNKVFTLPTAPLSGQLVLVFVGGILQNPGASNDYTISGKTITFALAPPLNYPVLVVY